MAQTLSIRLLGGFRLVHGGQRMSAVSGIRQQSLLAYLLLHQGPQNRRQVAFALWPQSGDAQSRTNLRRELHHLRRNLPNAAQYLNVEHQTLAWSPDGPYQFDVATFENALDQIAKGDIPNATAAATQIELLTQAVEIYRGPLLPDCYDDWIEPERRRLEERYQWALERLFQLQTDHGAYQQAIRSAQALLRHNAYHEPTYRRLMQLHVRNSNRSRAIEVYEQCVHVLGNELGIEPSAATRELHEQIVRDDRDLQQPVAQRVPLSPPLIGRHSELRQLQSLWEATCDGNARVVYIAGEPGIGKSRLAEEVQSWVARQGGSVAHARCYAAKGPLAYGPVAEWLRAPVLQARLQEVEDVRLIEVARILPDLLVEHPDLPNPLPMTERWQQRHLFEALSRCFVDPSRPLLLVLDDLQWCDAETVAWLRFLLHHFAHAPVLLIATLRPAEVGETHPVLDLLRWLRAAGQGKRIDLEPLSGQEIASLIEQTCEAPLEQGEMDDLVQKSAGNPLFAVEIVRMLANRRGQGGQTIGAEGVPVAVAQQGAEPLLPARVHAVIESRLARLSPVAQDVIAWAAVVGREFSVDGLVRASQQDEETLVRALDELWQRRLVREQDGGTYDFSHDYVRDVAYARVGPVRRRLLHRHVADALAYLHADDLASVSGEIARHYQRAERPEEAVTWYVRAGEHARQLYAGQDAIEQYTCALRLIERSLPSASIQHARLAALQSMARVYLGAGEMALAEASFRQALELAQQIDRPAQEQVQIIFWLAESLLAQQRPLEVVEIGREALALVEEGQKREVAMIHMVISSGYWALGNLEAGMSHRRALSALVDDLPYAADHRPLYTHTSLFSAFHERDLERAFALLRTFEEGAQQAGDQRGEAVAALQWARIYYFMGDFSKAAHAYRRSLSTLEAVGDRWHIAACLADHGRLFLAQGKLSAAESHLSRALQIAQEDEIDQSMVADLGMVHLAIVDFCRRCNSRARERLVLVVSHFDQIQNPGATEALLARYVLGAVLRAQRKEPQAMDQILQALRRIGARRDQVRWEEPWPDLVSALAATVEPESYQQARKSLAVQPAQPDSEFAPSPGTWQRWEGEEQPPNPRFQGAAFDEQLWDFRLIEQLPEPWQWYDPMADCRYTFDDGLVLYASNGRNLQNINFSAPRLLQTIEGDFRIRVTCAPAYDEMPGMGGLFLWLDKDHFLRLDWGARGRTEIGFGGFIANQWSPVGRGCVGAGLVRLQLERVADQISALFSVDGNRWHSVGRVVFQVGGALDIGLFAQGAIDRSIYPGAFPDGTAIRFLACRLWRS